MQVLTQVSILDAFLIFWFTLGPLKALDPFTQATRVPTRPFAAAWPGGPPPSPWLSAWRFWVQLF